MPARGWNSFTKPGEKRYVGKTVRPISDKLQFWININIDESSESLQPVVSDHSTIAYEFDMENEAVERSEFLVSDESVTDDIHVTEMNLLQDKMPFQKIM